jgi:hypothetical protein
MTVRVSGYRSNMCLSSLSQASLLQETGRAMGCMVDDTMSMGKSFKMYFLVWLTTWPNHCQLDLDDTKIFRLLEQYVSVIPPPPPQGLPAPGNWLHGWWHQVCGKVIQNVLLSMTVLVPLEDSKFSFFLAKEMEEKWRSLQVFFRG